MCRFLFTGILELLIYSPKGLVKNYVNHF